MNSEDGRLRFQTDPTDPRHGTANGYSNLRCRCKRCRMGWRTSPSQQRAQDRYRRDLIAQGLSLNPSTGERKRAYRSRPDARGHYLPTSEATS